MKQSRQQSLEFLFSLDISSLVVRSGPEWWWLLLLQMQTEIQDGNPQYIYVYTLLIILGYKDN